MSNEFKQYNPDIIGNKLIGEESFNKATHRRIHDSMSSLGVIQKDYNIISSTYDNLCYGLIPSYSQLYKNGQIKLNDIGKLKEEEDSEKIKIILDYLKDFKGDLNNIAEYNNDITLISQFSGLMIKSIINGEVLNNEYILGKLFRKQSSSKIKEYYQLETVLKDHNLESVIIFLEKLISKTVNKEFIFKEIKEKSFPFVSPGFEFTFTDGEDNSIKIVGGYVDDILLNSVGINSNYFIFGANVNKFSEINGYTKKGLNSSWRDIYVSEDISKILSITSDIKKVKSNVINIQPNKIELLLKNRLDLFFGIDRSKKLETEVNIKGNQLVFIGNWKNDFFENIPYYLTHYYGGKVININENELIIEFNNFDIENFGKIFIESESSINMFVANEEISDFLGVEIDLLSLHNEFRRIGCNIEKHENGYLIKIPAYKKNIKSYKDVLGEIISFIFNNYRSNNKYYAEVIKITGKNEILNKINFDIPNFFISNGFSELDLKAVGKPNKNKLDILLGKAEKLASYDLELTNTLLNGVINELLTKNAKLENKGFSIEKLGNGYNIIFYINCKKGENLLNITYDYLFTIGDIIGLDKINLKINNDLEFLEKGKSFLINSEKGKNIGYIGKLSDSYKIKGDLYFGEITINN